MKVISTAFDDDARIPSEFTCEGPNVSPPLQFSDVPKDAKSLVLMVEDQDAPSKPWVHWLVFNIPATAAGFERNSIPDGAVQGLCNGGTFGYEGPCPPQNEHTYLFKLYALDKMLDIPAASDRKKVLQEIEGHVIAETVLKGKYKKEKVAVA